MFYRPERSEWIALARGPWHRRLGRSRAARATVAALCLIVLATNTFLLTQRGRTTPVTLDDALASYRSTNGTMASVDDAAGILTAAVEQSGLTQGTSVVAVTAGAVAGGGPVATTVAAGEVVATGPTQATGPAAFVRPERGVYTYAVTGGEKISILGAGHAYPERVFATVEHGTGCMWRFTTHLAKEHVEFRSFCSQPDQLSVLEDSGTVEFFGQKDTVGYTCGSGAVVVVASAAPGTIHHATCTSPSNGENKLRVTQIGLVPINIGNQTVLAQRFRSEATMTGRSVGSAVFEYWVDSVTGLPLRFEKNTHTFAKSSFGDVQYDEEATLQLVSLEPQT